MCPQDLAEGAGVTSIIKRLVDCVNTHASLAHSHQRMSAALLALVQVFMSFASAGTRAADSQSGDAATKREHSQWCAYYMILAAAIVKMRSARHFIFSLSPSSSTKRRKTSQFIFLCLHCLGAHLFPLQPLVHRDFLTRNTDQLCAGSLADPDEVPAFLKQDILQSRALREALSREELTKLHTTKVPISKGDKKGASDAEPQVIKGTIRKIEKKKRGKRNIIYCVFLKRRLYFLNR